MKTTAATTKQRPRDNDSTTSAMSDEEQPPTASIELTSNELGFLDSDDSDWDSDDEGAVEDQVIEDKKNDYDDNDTVDHVCEYMRSNEFRKSFALMDQQQQQEYQPEQQPSKITQRGSHDGFDFRICAVALVCFCIVVGAVVGAMVGTYLNPLQNIDVSASTNNTAGTFNETASIFEEAEDTFASAAPSTTPSAEETTAPVSTSCTTKSHLSFPDGTAVTLFMSVRENVTQSELEYAAFVLQQSYNSLWESGASCDAYCRHIQSVTFLDALFVHVPSTTFNAPTGKVQREDESCQQTFKGVLKVKGSYWDCDDEGKEADSSSFPGLFAASHAHQQQQQPENDVEDTNNGVPSHDGYRRWLLQWQKQRLSSFNRLSVGKNGPATKVRHGSTTDGTGSRNLVYQEGPRTSNMMRRQVVVVVPEGEATSCGQECSGNGDNTTAQQNMSHITPTLLIQRMEPQLSILPGICNIKSIQ